MLQSTNDKLPAKTQWAPSQQSILVHLQAEPMDDSFVLLIQDLWYLRPKNKPINLI